MKWLNAIHPPHHFDPNVDLPSGLPVPSWALAYLFSHFQVPWVLGLVVDEIISNLSGLR
jgi:hypothetical protein